MTTPPTVLVFSECRVSSKSNFKRPSRVFRHQSIRLDVSNLRSVPERCKQDKMG